MVPSGSLVQGLQTSDTSRFIIENPGSWSKAMALAATGDDLDRSTIGPLVCKQTS